MTIGMVVVAFMAATVLRMVPGHDDVHVQPNHVGCKRGQSLHLAVGKAVLDDDILANAITEISQALIEGIDEMKLRLPGPSRKIANPINPSGGLLRTRGQRPRRRRSTKKRDELAPLHVAPKAQETVSWRFNREH